MRSSRTAFFRLFGLLGLVTAMARGDPKVTQESMGPDGDSLGCSISPAGAHVAVLANQGSHLAVFFDGVAGPKIDGLQASTSAAGNSRLRPSGRDRFRSSTRMTARTGHIWLESVTNMS